MKQLKLSELKQLPETDPAAWAKLRDALGLTDAQLQSAINSGHIFHQP